MNITLVAGSLYCLLLLLRVPQKAAAVTSIFLVFLHVAVAGFKIPVERAGLMAAFAFAGILLERERNTLNLFFFAYLALLILNPQNLNHLSFQLSFLSVLCLILFLGRSPEEWTWTEEFQSTLAVMAGTLPVVVSAFHVFSFSGFFSNLLAIPLFHLALLFSFPALFLEAVPVLGRALLWISQGALEAGLFWIRLCARLPASYVYLASPPRLLILGYYAGLLAFYGAWKGRESLIRWKLFLFRSWVLAGSGGFWLACLVLFFLPRPSQDFTLTLFAAGKNEVIHFQASPSQHWLINTGRRLPTDQAHWILEPYLKAHGVQRLSGVILSDFYKKHTGGMETLLRNFSMHFLLFPETGPRPGKKPETFLPKKPSRRMNLIPVRPRYQIEIPPGARLTVLDVVEGQMLINMEIGSWNFLMLPGRGPKILEALRNHRERILRTDVLIHFAEPYGTAGPGFAGPSPQMNLLFDWIDPLVVLAPHPDEGLDHFLRDRGIPLYDTARQGSITLSISRKDLPAANQAEDWGGVLNARSFLQGSLGIWRKEIKV